MKNIFKISAILAMTAAISLSISLDDKEVYAQTKITTTSPKEFSLSIKKPYDFNNIFNIKKFLEKNSKDRTKYIVEVKKQVIAALNTETKSENSVITDTNNNAKPQDNSLNIQTFSSNKIENITKSETKTSVVKSTTPVVTKSGTRKSCSSCNETYRNKTSC